MAAVSAPHALLVESEADVQQKFDALVEQWNEETGYLSSMTAVLAHPAYQNIIAMGFPAVPLIMRELNQKPDYWFRALNAITNQNPVPQGSNFEQTRQAWLEWGHRQGYIASGKIGKFEDIEHQSLSALEGRLYGKVIQIMKRAQV